MQEGENSQSEKEVRPLANRRYKKEAVLWLLGIQEETV